MTTENELREKLRKIEALFRGAGTSGERDAAFAALARIKEKINQTSSSHSGSSMTEMQFTLNNSWSRKLFLALARRHGLKPFRYKRQRYTTVMLRGPDIFLNNVLWPEFVALDEVLKDYLNAATEKIIKEEVHDDTNDAAEILESSLIPFTPP